MAGAHPGSWLGRRADEATGRTRVQSGAYQASRRSSGRFSRITRAQSVVESRRYARDLLKVSVIYLPLLLTAMMLNAIGKVQ